MTRKEHIDDLDTEKHHSKFSTHDTVIDENVEIPAGEGAVIAGPLEGTGEITGEGSLAGVWDTFDAVMNPVREDVDFDGNVAVSLVWESGSTRPSSPIEGQCFFDSSLGQPIWYNGTDWVDALGGII